MKEVPWSKRWQPNSLWYVIIVDYTVYLVLQNRIQWWNKFTNLTLCNKYICKDIKIKDSYTNAICNQGTKIWDYANRMKQGCGQNWGKMVKQIVLQLRYIWTQILPQSVTIMTTIIVAVTSICSLQDALSVYKDIYYLKDQFEKGSMSMFTI